MSMSMVLEEIVLVGRDEEYRKIPFTKGVNIIVGPTGTGKSSLLELIKYTMGRDAKITDAVNRGLVKSVMKINFESASFSVARYIGGKTIEVRRAKDGIKIGDYAVKPRNEEPSASDFMLEMLGIPSIRIPRSRSRPGKDSANLTFSDIFRYLYLPQREIDRSVVRHLDRYLDPKRRAAFQLLYGLTNEAISRMEVESGKVKDEIKDRKRGLQEVNNYLKRAGHPLEGDLLLEREVVRSELAEFTQEAERTRKGLITSTDSEKHARQELHRLYLDLRESSRRLSESRAVLEENRSLIAQLELDRDRLKKSKVSDDELATIDFKVCPGCMQDLPANRGGNSACPVCLQGLPRRDIALEVSVEQEIARVSRQIHETQELRNEEQEVAQGHSETVGAIKEEIRLVESDLDDRITQYVSPKMEVMKSLVQRISEKKSRIQAIVQALKHWEEHSLMRDNIAKSEQRHKNLIADIEMERYRLDEARERIKELSDVFSSIMDYYKLRWYKSGRIDRESYLPIVNGFSLEDITAGSGGLPTLINGAYHLASLVFAILHGESLVPKFLIIDSPRKNLGNMKDDKQASVRVYNYYRTLLDTYGNKFQLIVADNDIPVGYSEFVSLRLTYDNPLVPGIEHPGEGNVKLIGEDDENGESQLSLIGP